MKRKIITIDEEKCNGCGLCIPDCPEGALQMIDGKARLVSDLFCDGLGACIGTCPEGAISVIEREAEPYDERKVMENIARQGQAVIEAHLEHLEEHGEADLLEEAVCYLREKGIPVPRFGKAAVPVQAAGCPGSRTMTMQKSGTDSAEVSAPVSSELRQWPVQLKLLNPAAPYFENTHLLLAADCGPLAYGGFHRDFIRERVVVMFCPKLDPYMDEYIDKLAAVFSMHDIQSVTVARMEVPCCGGITHVLNQAMEKAGKEVPVAERVITIQGGIR